MSALPIEQLKDAVLKYFCILRDTCLTPHTKHFACFNFVNLFVLLLEKIAGGVDRHNLRQSQGV